MVVQCPSCATKFRLDETKIGAKGAKVRCSKCDHSFVVKRAEAPPVSANEQATAPIDVQAAKARAGVSATLAAMEAAATVPGPPGDFAATLELERPPARPRVTEPALDLAHTDPTLPELPDLPPGAPVAPLARDPVHEAQTAVYTVPDSIRAAAAAQEREQRAAAAALGSQDLAGIDLDDDEEAKTNVISPEALAAIRASTRAEPPAALPPTVDIPMADADLLDPGEFDLVTNTAMDSAAALVTQPDAPSVGDLPPVLAAPPPSAPPPAPPADADDPFADHNFAPSGGVTADGVFIPPESAGAEAGAFAGGGSGPKAVGRIQPAVAGVSAPVAAAVPKPTPAGAPAAPSRARRPWSIGIKIVTTVFALLLLSLGVLLFLSGGRIDTVIAKLQRGKLPEWGVPVQQLGYLDVVPVSMRSVLYPTRAGRQVLVFVGEVENRSAEPRAQIDAVAELRDRAGRLTATARAPVGAVLGPVELFGLVDAASLKAAYQDVQAAKPPAPLPSRATAGFSVVLLNPPAGLSELSHQVRLAAGESPAPPSVTAPPPAPPPEPALDEEGKLKGKKGKKGKKAKRKAKVSEELE